MKESPTIPATCKSPMGSPFQEIAVLNQNLLASTNMFSAHSAAWIDFQEQIQPANDWS